MAHFATRSRFGFAVEVEERASFLGDVVMTNLIGDDLAQVPDIAQETGALLHLYGKAEARPGRKMGHVTRVIAPASDR